MGIGRGTSVYIGGSTHVASFDRTLQDAIAMDPATHGSMFVPIILGSDQTTVSVVTGQHAYHPVYLLIRNVHNCT